MLFILYLIVANAKRHIRESSQPLTSPLTVRKVNGFWVCSEPLLTGPSIIDLYTEELLKVVSE